MNVIERKVSLFLGLLAIFIGCLNTIILVDNTTDSWWARAVSGVVSLIFVIVGIDMLYAVFMERE